MTIINERMANERSLLPINGDLNLTCAVSYSSERPDLDCELIPDVLQKAGVIVNDRQIREKYYKRLESSKQPLAVITIDEVK